MSEAPTFDIHPQALCPRRAGLVKRYHVWPVIHEQNVAAHTWQLIRIMLSIWPDVPREVIVYAMLHDAGEVATGDIPYPVKAGNATLRREVENLDTWACNRMSETMLLPPAAADVPEVLGPGGLTKTFFKLCEMVEMWEHLWHEVNLGNRYAAAICQKCWNHMVVLRDQLSVAAEDGDEDVFAIVVRFDDYVRARVAYETEVAEGADVNV